MPEPCNASVYLVDRHVEAGRGNRVAIHGPGGDITYEGLLACVSDAASGLVELGVGPEDRVVLVMEDGPEMVAAFLGAMRLGAVPVPVNTMLTAGDLTALAINSRARVAVTTPRFAGKAASMASAAPELKQLVVAGGAERPEATGVRVHRWDEAMSGHVGRFTPYSTWDESPGFWLYTSGTTGRPRGAMHRHIDLRVTFDTYARTVLNIQEDDRCFSVAKLFFAYGLGNSMTFPLGAGASTILDPELPTPKGVADTVLRTEPTLFFGVPTSYAALLAADLPEDTFRSVRYAVSAGEPLPAGLFRRFRDRFGVEILDGIGSTEALHIFISNKPGRIRPGTTGTPVEGYEARLLDDMGNVLEGQASGHLEISGESVAMGYWCSAANTRQNFRGRWLHTGDMYARSEDGYYAYLARSDDMIKAGGIWVSPAEVEAVLIEHPSILEAGVVGVPDVEGLAKPAAFAIAKPGCTLDAEEVIAFCHSRLAPFKRPRRVVILDELPKTATGKIQRFRLRQMLQSEGGTGAG